MTIAAVVPGLDWWNQVSVGCGIINPHRLSQTKMLTLEFPLESMIYRWGKSSVEQREGVVFILRINSSGSFANSSPHES